MVANIVLIFCVVAASTLVEIPAVMGGLPHAAGYGDYYAYPRYNYQYAVGDLITGDRKQVRELRDGSYVTGGYSAIQPFGLTEVNYEFAGGHSIPRPVAVPHPVPVAAPVVGPIAGSAVETIVGPVIGPISGPLPL